MPQFRSDEFPRLRNVLHYYAPGCEEVELDPDTPGEAATRWWPDEGLPELQSELEAVHKTLHGLDEASAAGYLRMQTALPAGGSWTDWLRYLGSHLESFYPRRVPQTIGRDGIQLPRASKFDDKDVGNRATTDVLRANENLLRAWSAGHDGTWRLHLYANLGRRVGTYLLSDEVQAFRDAGDDHALRPTSREATGCVVVMRRDHATGTPFIATAHPEMSLPLAPRARFPDLPLLFGGYFGQDCTALDGNRWTAERNVNHSTGAAVRERLAEQLTQLLAEDDESLRSSVEALGSYVMPTAMRRWVTGLHRRMTRLDW
jgi:hypothetical protein